MFFKRVVLLAVLSLPLTAVAEDRFTPIIEHAGDLVANAGGYVVHQKRVAVQHELSRQAPTPAELGVQLPPKSALKLELTARQIAQYHVPRICHESRSWGAIPVPVHRA